MTADTMPDRIWAQPAGDALYINPGKGRYRTAKGGTEYLALHGETLAEVRKALQFYAEIERYKAPLTGGQGDLYFDCGQVARAALAKMGG